MKEIARHRTWADDPCGTRCGAGSSIEATKPLASFLEGLCRSEVAASITDLGCGDLHWISNVDLFGVSYRPERPKSARKRAHPLAGVTRPPLRGRDPRTSAELSGTERTYIHPHQGHLGIYLRDSGGSIVNGAIYTPPPGPSRNQSQGLRGAGRERARVVFTCQDIRDIRRLITIIPC